MQTTTSYARSGEVHIAYQVLGSGQPLVLVADWFSHLDTMWEWPPFAHALRRLASIARLIVFDKRGVGLSDPVPVSALPGLEEWMDDVRAVLDDLALESASLLAVGSGGCMAMQFAASHPQRVDKLVLVNAYARLLRADDYAPGWPERLREPLLARRNTDDGTARVLAGADAGGPFIAWWGKYQRQSVPPGVALAMRRMMTELDVRAVLPTICAPTLILHRAGDEWIRVAHARYLAEHIRGARLVELDGAEDLFYQGDVDTLLDRVDEFMGAPVQRDRHDRVLATVLFTDVVESTALAARLGDRRWKTLLDDHDAIVRAEVERFQGRPVAMRGDGVLAVFDGPARAVRCAASIRDQLRLLGLEVRAGVHTGEIEVRGPDVGGIAVHLAARIMDLGIAGEVLVSRTVRDLVAGSGLGFVDHGKYQLKGVPGTWEVLRAVV